MVVLNKKCGSDLMNLRGSLITIADPSSQNRRTLYYCAASNPHRHLWRDTSTCLSVPQISDIRKRFNLLFFKVFYR